MGGSGGAGYFSSRDGSLPALSARVEKAVVDKKFVADVNGYLSTVLANLNDRDAELTARRLNAVKEAIDAEHETEIDIRFAGSVSKKTYVEGLSDVDALVFVDGTDLAEQTPKAVKRQLAEILGRYFPDETVTAGKLAVTKKPLLGLEALPAASRATTEAMYCVAGCRLPMVTQQFATLRAVPPTLMS